MAGKVLVVSILSISLAAFGQTSAPSSQDTNSNSSTQTVLAPTTGGTAWTGVGPAGGVLLSTPSATFDSPQPTAGISVAGRAGISNSTPVNAGLQSTLSPSSMVYVYTPGSNTFSTAPVAENPA